MNLQISGKGNGKENGLANKVTTVLFIIYMIALFWILLFKLGVRFSYMEKRSVNLEPFREPLISHGKLDISQIILNVVIFVPLGIYVGVLSKRWNFISKLLCFFLVSLMFEVFQYIFRVGAFDITDIITNTSGGIIGLVIFEAIEKAFNDSIKAQKFINFIAAIGTVVMVSLLFLLKMNMLPVRYR
jgi:glycopeptide antibiotics resistance protein